MRHKDVEEVGAADPQRRNSPVIDDTDELEEPVVSEAGSGVCYYNDAEYPVGTYVSSGGTLLRCEQGGVWSCVGESYE